MERLSNSNGGISARASRVMYTGMIRPVFTWGAELWHCPRHTQRLEYRALRKITGASFGSSHRKLAWVAGVEPLESKLDDLSVYWAWQCPHRRHGSVDIGGMAVWTSEAWQCPHRRHGRCRHRRHGSVDIGGTTILLPMRTELAGLPGQSYVEQPQVTKFEYPNETRMTEVTYESVSLFKELSLALGGVYKCKEHIKKPKGKETEVKEQRVRKPRVRKPRSSMMFAAVEPGIPRHAPARMTEPSTRMVLAASAYSEEVRLRDEVCKISKYWDGSQVAHIVPKEKAEWFVRNGLGIYNAN
ncbi:hypothetical protein EV426DRAFT_703448 [Tirmania nivea]|nr:hypothetical protein EV426DRAFT_703448 [Tirmania nivea]